MDLAKVPYGMPFIFRTPVWFTLPSDSDARIKLKPAKYKDIMQYSEMLYASKLNIDAQLFDNNIEIISDAIVDMDNIYGFSNNEQLLRQLSNEDKQFIIEKYGLLSVITEEQLTQY